MLALKNVSHQYGSIRVLARASLSVKPKDCLCIVGDGASGKSTIMRLLSREEDPTSGSVEVDNIKLTMVPPAILQLYRRRIGLIHQEPMLLEHSTVAENVSLPLQLFGAPKAVIDRNTGDLLKRLRIDGYAQRLTENLPQSIRTLTAIARAVSMSPMILLADEPLEHLDDSQSKAVTDLLKTMHKNGTTLILFSRSSDTASAFGARVVTLKDGALSASAKSATSAPASTSTHRILEETETRLQHILDMGQPTQKPKPGTPKNDRKIKITSIGSGL